MKILVPRCAKRDAILFQHPLAKKIAEQTDDDRARAALVAGIVRLSRVGSRRTGPPIRFKFPALLEGSEAPRVNASSPESTSDTAFDAFSSEVAKSPLLRQYAAAAAKKAAAKRKAESESSNEKDEVNLQDEYIAGLAFGRRLRSRFLSPRIDDPGLLYADAFVCIGGALFVAQWALSPAVPPDIKIPPPSWLAAARGVN